MFEFIAIVTIISVNVGLVYGFLTKIVPSKPFLYWLDGKAAAFFIEDVFKNQKEWNFKTYSNGEGFYGEAHGIRFDFEKGYSGRIYFPDKSAHYVSDLFHRGIRLYYIENFKQKGMWDHYEEIKIKRINELLDTLDSQSEEEFYKSINSKTKTKAA